MKFSAVAVLAAAAGASAWKSNVTYTTEVVTAYTTYCPAPTEITHNGETYTVTSATTLTITNCPCTITKPVITSSTSYQNHTTAAGVPTGPAPVPTGGVTTLPGTISPSATKPATTTLATAGAGKAAALSGGALAGVLGLAAFVL